MTAIVCCDINHAARSHLPGWSAVLGEATGGAPHSTWGYMCDACAAAWRDRRRADLVLGLGGHPLGLLELDDKAKWP